MQILCFSFVVFTLILFGHCKLYSELLFNYLLGAGTGPIIRLDGRLITLDIISMVMSVM